MNFQPGIFAKIYLRPSLGEVLSAMTAHGIRQTQFNLVCAGLESLPERIEPVLLDQIRSEFERSGIQMAAVSGTYNMIHPDQHKRDNGQARLKVLIQSCAGLGTKVVTLCSGTRDPENMWREHPDNGTREAWNDLLKALEAVLPVAEEQGVILAFEPEPANVIDRPQKGRRLLDDLRSPNLKVVMDAANLFHPGELNQIPKVFQEAFDALGGEIVLAHAKDLDAAGNVVAAGKGVLNFPLYLSLLREARYSGPLVLHSLTEAEVPESLAFLNRAVNG